LSLRSALISGDLFRAVSMASLYATGREYTLYLGPQRRSDYHDLSHCSYLVVWAYITSDVQKLQGVRRGILQISFLLVSTVAHGDE